MLVGDSEGIIFYSKEAVKILSNTYPEGERFGKPCIYVGEKPSCQIKYNDLEKLIKRFNCGNPILCNNNDIEEQEIATKDIIMDDIDFSYYDE